MKERINLLDSYRFIAVVMVMLYHYYVRWAYPISKNGLYSYNYSFNFLKFGYLGVEFFFIISGFAICYTLTKTNSIAVFFKKRFIRLFPTMVLCSTLTYLLFLYLDSDLIFSNSHYFRNVIFSCTFLSPKITEFIEWNLNYVDGSYWSLWVEIQFYIISAIIYFMRPKRFLCHFVILSFLIFSCHILLNSNYGKGIILKFTSVQFYTVLRRLDQIFNIAEYILWFLFGIIFYRLFQDKKKYSLVFLLCILSFIQLYFLKLFPVILISILFLLLFFIMIYKPNWLIVLKSRIFLKIGIASYPLYLIHQNIGVLILNSFYGKLNAHFFMPLIICVVLIVFSLFIFKYFEKPISHYLISKN